MPTIMRARSTAVPACPVQCMTLMSIYSSNSPKQPVRQIDRQTVIQTKILHTEELTSSL